MKRVCQFLSVINMTLATHAQWNAESSQNRFIAGNAILRSYSQVIAGSGGSFHISYWYATGIQADTGAHASYSPVPAMTPGMYLRISSENGESIRKFLISKP